MDTRDSGLVTAIESFWNGWATARKEKDVILIVCASANYWILDNIVNSRGGLHNRLTGQIHLKPFTLGECEDVNDFECRNAPIPDLTAELRFPREIV